MQLDSSWGVKEETDGLVSGGWCVDQGLVAMTRMVLPQMVERDRGKSGDVALSGGKGGPVRLYRLSSHLARPDFGVIGHVNYRAHRESGVRGWHVSLPRRELLRRHQGLRPSILAQPQVLTRSILPCTWRMRV
jgi:hypothetical protein